MFQTPRFRSLYLRLRADDFELVSARPLVMRHPSFLDEKQCKTLITAAEGKFVPSRTTHGVSPNRTSYSASVHLSSTPGLLNRLLALVGDPSLSLQQPPDVVRYELGQKFTLHHDADPRGAAVPEHQRPYTFFAYLNNVDEKAGGATSFPLMKPPFRQQPRQGVCLFWANWSEDYAWDKQVRHVAEPILTDVTKYGLNLWIQETRP